MRQRKHFPYLPFLGMFVVILALLTPSADLEAGAAPPYQEQGGAWDTAVKHAPWTFYGYDVVKGDELCQLFGTLPPLPENTVLYLGNWSTLDDARFLEIDNFMSNHYGKFSLFVQELLPDYDRVGLRINTFLEEDSGDWMDLLNLLRLPPDSSLPKGYSRIDWRCNMFLPLMYSYSYLDRNIFPIFGDYQPILRDNPTKKANMFQVTPWISKFNDSDPYHDWYLLDLKVFHDANLSGTDPNKGILFTDKGGIGWFAEYRDIKVQSGNPQNVFLIDWSPKTQAETYTQTTESGFTWGCTGKATIEATISSKEGASLGPSAGGECSFGFSSSDSISKEKSDMEYKKIESHIWSIDEPDVVDFISWNEDIRRWNDPSTLPKIASQDYLSNRMMVWETSQPLDGAMLEMYMWAGFRFILMNSLEDRQCLGIKPGEEDHSTGCVTGNDGDEIKVGDDVGEIFRLVQYRPPVIPLSQQPTSTSPVWINQPVKVTFDPVKDPDGDYLLYQFDFGDGTFYPPSECATNPKGDLCQDKVCYDVCVGRDCATTQPECLVVKCDADGCFGPSLSVQHTWTRSSAADLMGVKSVRVRAAEAQCFPDTPTGTSPCVEKAKEYLLSDNYDYKSGWSGSFPVTIQGLSSISVEGPISGDLSDNSSWTMQCQGKWYNQGTPFEEDCSVCNEDLTWKVTDGAGKATTLATIDDSGLLEVATLPEGKKVDNVMVRATCKDHGVTKTDSISLAIKASAESKPTEELTPTGIRWEYIAITVLALFILLSWILFSWVGWKWRLTDKPKVNKKPHV